VAELYLEAIYVLECVAPPPLHVDRFLAPTPLDVVVDHQGNDVTARWTAEALTRRLKSGAPHRWLDQPGLREEMLPRLVERTEQIAQRQGASVLVQARREMNAQLGHEISRMQDLQRINRQVRAEEIELLIGQQRALDQHLANARLRLDALRLIQRGPL
jgi:ATP-dependent helicase HepA